MTRSSLNALLLFSLLCLAGMLESCGSSSASGSSKLAEIAVLMENNQFIFSANQMSPLRAQMQNLNGGFEFICTGDSLISYLPYIGNAFGGQSNTSQSVLDFHSLKYTYDKVVNKRGGWDITIKPLDYSAVQSMMLNVTQSGSAQLSVQFSGRDPISFSGVISSKQR